MGAVLQAKGDLPALRQSDNFNSHEQLLQQEVPTVRQLQD
jgi:hypothetical protein